jgi:glutamine synthetase
VSGLRPVIATEIEFYLYGSHERDLTAFWAEVSAACNAASIAIFNMEKERGHEQHEVSLCPSRDVAKIVADTERLKTIITDSAAAHGMRADFSARPLQNQPGSGLHVHVHLEDAAGNNLYTKDDANISDALAHSIAGLLATLPENMPVFAPTEDSRKRFVPGSNAPSTLSWGANNRTCAIRLPDKPHTDKHIEHRVAGADADVGAVVAAILRGIEHGITRKLIPPPQIYGDAALPMYGLPPLIASN